MEIKMVSWPQIIDIDKGYSMCFGCGGDNPIGLKLSFQWDGKVAKTEFTPGKLHQGWADVVHGGIINAILDEAMSYAAIFKGLFCITAKMETRLRRPAVIDEPLIITSSITRNTRRLVEAKANISLKDGTLIAESKATLFVIGKKEDKTKSNA